MVKFLELHILCRTAC